jgi:catechol 2,3-dioxygenase-like lactoylglutathione lyase family enzyme
MAVSVRRMLRIERQTDDPERAAAFYISALDFEAVTACSESEAGVRSLRLGAETLRLVGATMPGARRRPARSFDRWFQHLAIAVADMDRAYARLAAVPGLEAITRGGPQQLPPASGSVTAFKFRDPDGHPLELLQFPAGRGPEKWRRPQAGRLFLGVDHSAITVADTGRSITFYERALGLKVSAQSLNQGPVQARLDDATGAIVEVTALVTSDPASAHVELLCYRHPQGEPGEPGQSGATLVFEDGVAVQTCDPDGHALVIAPGHGSTV